MGSKKKKGKVKTGKPASAGENNRKPGKKSMWFRKNMLGTVLIALSFILYANTLGHDYTQDDAIVIYDNMFTQEGIAGIPGILKYDTFYGFFKTEGKANLVSGGRYRPFTLLMFAVEWELFGRNPMIGHLINILLYGLLCAAIFLFLQLLLKDTMSSKAAAMLSFMVALIYLAHPIHTEAVANIKGRDEIMSMLGSIVAFWALLKYGANKSNKYLVLSALSFFAALMSKENAITFLGIVPIGLMLFRKRTMINALKLSFPLFISAFVFLLIRFSILGMDFGASTNELMNNPFLKVSGNSWVPFSAGEKMATILYTLGKYVSLLIFPHPLCHDYYPRAIDIMQFSDWKVLLSLFVYIAMITASVYFWKKDRIISFGILFYLLSLSIVSNIVFPIGTNMSERFVFIPSLGFIILAWGIFYKYIPQERLLLALTGLIFLAFSYKTISRNTVWKDDFTLFTNDVKINNNSAKLLNAAGGALTTNASKMQAGNQRTNDLNQAIVYLKKAVTIHPTYRNAYLLLGNAYYYLQDFESSIFYFDKSLEIDPNFNDALQNLPVVLRDGGRDMGQKKQNFAKAEEWLLRSYQMNPTDYETCRLLGITYGIQGQNQKAVDYFLKAVDLRPDVAANHSSLGTAYINIGEQEKAREAFNRAVEIDPDALKHLRQ